MLAAAAVLTVLGVVQSRSAQTEVLPEFYPPYVEVQTEALGLSAEEVEQLITAPMENLMLNGVAFLDGIRSESVNGLSSITLIFEPGTDLLDARQVVQERLTQVGQLPYLTELPTIVQPTSSLSRVLVVGFRSTEVSAIEMSVLARWMIRPRLLGVPGVANVAIFGQRERQLQVQVDPKRLARRGVTLQEVVNTSGNALWVSPLTYLQASAPGTGGFVDTPTSRLEVRHVSPIAAASDLRKVALERADGSRGGAALTLGDVARVTEDHQPLIGDAVVDDGPGLIMVIEKFPGADTTEVTRGIEDALDTLSPGLEGIAVDTDLFRPATFVEQARDNYALSLAAGLLLAALVVLLVLLDLRSLAVVVASTVVSLLVSVLALDLLGVRLDALSLAGLALAAGVVLIDAAGDTVHVSRRLRDPVDAGQATDSVVQDASWQVRSVAGYATAISLVTLLPLLAVDPLAEAFFGPALAAFAVTVVTSTVVSLTFTPALASVLLSRRATDRDRRLRGFATVAERAGGRLVGSGHRAVWVLAVGLVVTAGLLPFVHGTERPGLLPELRERALVVSWQGEPGISREAMTTIAAELGADLRAVPGVANVGGHVGRAVLSDRVNGIGAGELWVTLDREEYDDTLAEVRRVTEEYDRAPVQVRSYAMDRVEAGGGLMSQFDRGRIAVRDDEVVVRIYGERFPVLSRQGDAVAEALAQVDGVDGVRVETPPVEPNLEVEVDLAAAERHGLKPGDIRRAATTLAAGLRVGSLFEEQKVFDVIVNGTRDYFADPALLGELLIDTPDGGTVPLADVAEVRPGTSFSVINRESVSRRLDLVATVSGDRGEVAADIEDAVAGIAFPLEYHAEVLVEDEGERNSVLLALAGLVAVIAALLLLQVVIRSWALALAALGVVGLSLVGGVIVAVVADDATVGTVLGFALVFALAVRNVLVLVSQRPVERTVSVVLAGAVTAAVLLPMAVLGSTAGLEIVNPMALVVVGGVVTATLVPLLLVPPLFRGWTQRRQPELLGDAFPSEPGPTQAGAR
ncbi:efflux RND transporter permease subunit [Nocardioides pyridinolyticus]